MGRMYSVETGFQSVSVAQDLLELILPATKCVVLHGIEIDQSSDYTAAEAEKLQVALKRWVGGTSGSGGGSSTPVALTTGDAASACTCERNNTTASVAGGGSLTTLHSYAWDALSGFERVFTPECRPVFAPSERVILYVAAPTDALTVNAKFIFEEIG